MLIASSTALRGEANNLMLDLPEPNAETATTLTDFDQLRHKLSQQVSERVASAIDNCRKELVSEIGSETIKAQRDFDSEATALKSLRRRRYLTIMFGFAGAGLLTFLIYHFLTQQPDQKLGQVILIGVFSSLVANCFGFVWARATDKFPMRLSRLAEESSHRLRTKIDKVCDAKRQTFSPASINQQQIAADILSVMTGRLSSVLSELDQALAAGAIGKINRVRSVYDEIRGKFHRLMDDLVR